MQCAKCNATANASDLAKCVVCEGYYHPGCSRLKTSEALRRLGARKTTWKCDSCTSETTSTKSDADQTDPAIIDILKTIQKDMAESRKENKTRFDQLSASIDNIKLSVEEFNIKLNSLQEENDKLKQEVTDMKEECRKLNEEMVSLKIEMLDMQQYSRRNNLEIKGVPTSQREDIFFLLESVARALNVPFQRGEVSAAHRVPARGQGHPPIIVAFISRQSTDHWLAAARTKRLQTTDISPRWQPAPVYINSYLTGHNKRILGRAKAMVKDRSLEAAWNARGKVVVRKAEGEPSQRIFFIEDLEKL